MSEILNVVGEEEFNNALLGDKPVLVDFWATWCMPCKMLSPILHEFHEEMGEKVKVVKVDCDLNEKLCRKYGVISIPMLLVFKNGEVVGKSVGLTTKAGISDLVIKHI